MLILFEMKEILQGYFNKDLNFSFKRTLSAVWTAICYLQKKKRKGSNSKIYQ